jgi:hypothetical protein
MRQDVSIVFFLVLKYWCTVEEFFFTVLGYWSATMVMDNHSLFDVYIDTDSLVREHVLRLAQTSIRNTTISPLELLLSVYACLLHYTWIHYTHNTFTLRTSSEILRSLQTFAYNILFGYEPGWAIQNQTQNIQLYQLTISILRSNIKKYLKHLQHCSDPYHPLAHHDEKRLSPVWRILCSTFSHVSTRKHQ